MAEETPLNLIEALTNPRIGRDTVDCKLTRIRAKLAENEQDALDKAVELIKVDDGLGRSKVYSASWLCSVLKQFGHSISASSVQRHLNGSCGCE
jgi:hypothetical protein